MQTMSPSIFSLYQDPTADSLKGPCSSVYVGLSERQLCDSTPSSTLHSLHAMGSYSILTSKHNTSRSDPILHRDHLSTEI